MIVLLMGFSWAFFFVQKLHEQLLSSSGLGPERCLVGGWPAPDFLVSNVFGLPYCDNLTIFGTQPGPVNAALDRVILAFEEAGFELHEIQRATPESEFLGCQLHGARGTLAVRDKKMWTLRSALLWAASGVRLSGRQVEKLVGHFIHQARFVRPALSIFRATYSFVRTGTRFEV
jgi:hypothetical protein